MLLELNHIMPVPLKERLSGRSSDIWNNIFRCEPGEYIKIKAPSGTGKTTLVHILYQLRFDYEGAVLFDQQNASFIKGDALAAFRQNKISIIFQDLRLFPNLTARENIELKRILQAPFHQAEKIDEMAARLGVTHILDQQTGICSYGEQQRIAIIRALIHPFEWLIMDEPFSHLDIENTKKAAALINEECQKRNAGLMITDLDDDDHFNYTRQLTL
jgi:putative ABC transport system ATP-binding protein